VTPFLSKEDSLMETMRGIYHNNAIESALLTYIINLNN